MQQTLERATCLPNTAIIQMVEPQLMLKSVDVLTTDIGDFLIPKQSLYRRDNNSIFEMKSQYLTGSNVSRT
jgi:hypothetical protein